jgi:hypothetical protein
VIDTREDRRRRRRCKVCGHRWSTMEVDLAVWRQMITALGLKKGEAADIEEVEKPTCPTCGGAVEEEGKVAWCTKPLELGGCRRTWRRK